MANHLTLDLETLGKSESSIILSLGAWIYNPETTDPDSPHDFYAEYDIKWQYSRGRTIDVDTLRWWHEPEQFPHLPKGHGQLDSGLANFFSWVKAFNVQTVWANGTDFDIPMLKHAASKFGLELPWKYNAVRDIRTISKLFDINPPREGIHHNALDDAKWNMEVIKEFTTRYWEPI